MASRKPKKAGRNHRPAVARRRRRSGQKSTVAPHPPVGKVERVLALDSSSRACGWSVFDDGQLVSYGHYVQQGEGHGEKLMNFQQWLLQVFVYWEPHQVIYEAPYQGRASNAYGVLSKYAGAIEAMHYEWAGREIDETGAMPAHVVKKLIGAKKGENHEANKLIVLLMVNEAFGLSLKYKSNDLKKRVSQDDDADAIALNWAWHIKFRYDKEAR